MATLLIYPNINLPFVCSIVCWAFRTVALGQSRATQRGSAQPDSLGMDARDKVFKRGLRRAQLYASNVNRKIGRQWKAYPACVGGWSRRLCALPVLLLGVLTFSRHARPWVVPLFFQAIVIIAQQRTKITNAFCKLCRVSSRQRARYPSAAQMQRRSFRPQLRRALSPGSNSPATVQSCVTGLCEEKLPVTNGNQWNGRQRREKPDVFVPRGPNRTISKAARYNSHLAVLPLPSATAMCRHCFGCQGSRWGPENTASTRWITRPDKVCEQCPNRSRYKQKNHSTTPGHLPGGNLWKGQMGLNQVLQKQ